MSKNVKNIKLKWLNERPLSLDKLSDFFNNARESKGGLYIWLYGNPKRIRYIGEAEEFKSRFYTHTYNITHGLYTALQCSKDEDLLEFYKKCNDIADDFDEHPIYRPKKICETNKSRPNAYAKLNSEDLKKYVKDIVRGIQMRWDEFKDTEFLFAEIIDDNGKTANADLRKEVEACVMKKTADTYKTKWKMFSRTTFGGSISRSPQKNTYYKFTCDGTIHRALQDIGITEEWEYCNEN
ncbi:MAG: hypothetical protein IJ529_03645 [Alphaproteobacteria bacterium]|nr:hypothetical protein [Alphaproteobacteria bacterium]